MKLVEAVAVDFGTFFLNCRKWLEKISELAYRIRTKRLKIIKIKRNLFILKAIFVIQAVFNFTRRHSFRVFFQAILRFLLPPVVPPFLIKILFWSWRLDLKNRLLLLLLCEKVLSTHHFRLSFHNRPFNPWFSSVLNLWKFFSWIFFTFLPIRINLGKIWLAPLVLVAGTIQNLKQIAKHWKYD